MATYFLIQSDSGQADTVADLVSGLPGVLSAAVTTGPYDVVAEVSPAHGREKQLRAAVRLVPGLCRLCVCQGPAARRTSAVAS
ncbi:MAG: hypothetical protein QOD07_2526 [Frankiaceae bacterium]|jgi:hypothetical protein|nr:hypothetical protein [Frankiaceae bacterium]